MDTAALPVTLAELGQLTPRALAAFASRVASRALMLLKPAADPAAVAVLADAARRAAAVAAGEPFDDANFLSRAYAAAETVHTAAGFAAFAPAHAARAAAFAAGNGPPDPDTAFSETLASAFGSVRAVLNTCQPAHEPLLRTAFRADLDRLLSLRPMPVALDPSERGPLGVLWPAGGPV